MSSTHTKPHSRMNAALHASSLSRLVCARTQMSITIPKFQRLTHWWVHQTQCRWSRPQVGAMSFESGRLKKRNRKATRNVAENQAHSLCNSFCNRLGQGPQRVAHVVSGE